MEIHDRNTKAELFFATPQASSDIGLPPSEPKLSFSTIARVGSAAPKFSAQLYCASLASRNTAGKMLIKFESMRKFSLLNLRSQRSVTSPSKFLRRENATRYEGLANPITAKRGEIRVLAAGCSSDDFESSSDRGCAQSDRSAVLEKNFSFPTQANWKLFSGCKFSGEIYSGCRVRKPTG